MEKRKPTYGLDAFKAAVAGERIVFTKTAALATRALGYTDADIAQALAALERKHFFKSMTSYADHRQWQDVYHLPHDGLTLYVKFTADAVMEFLVLSFTEK